MQIYCSRRDILASRLRIEKRRKRRVTRGVMTRRNRTVAVSPMNRRVSSFAEDGQPIVIARRVNDQSRDEREDRSNDGEKKTDGSEQGERRFNGRRFPRPFSVLSLIITAMLNSNRFLAISSGCDSTANESSDRRFPAAISAFATRLQRYRGICH